MTDTHGHCAPQFQPVADLFAANFDELDEIGASLCLSVEGETVVDLWGGHRDKRRTATWDRDTLCVVFSNTKAATSLCAHILAERGELDLNAPVARYWPEFAANGKAGITVAMLLNHTAGMVALREEVKPLGYADWDYMCARYAAEAPFWTPGSRTGYHMISFGWLVGEVIARISGKSLGRFFADEVAGPLGLDFWIGLPEAEEHRVATVKFSRMPAGEEPSEFIRRVIADTHSMQALSMLNLGGLDYNTRVAHGAEIGAAGGIANARAVCGMFTPLANGGGSLVSPERIETMRALSSHSDRDATFLIPTRFAQGFMLSMDNRATCPGEGRSFIIGDGAFGHVGAGGSAGFADPDKRLAFSYVMNRLGNEFLLNERGQRLIDAAYGCL